MAITKTLTQLRARVRQAHRRTSGLLPDADIDPLVNEQMRNLWALCARLNRDLYTKTSNSFTITAGQNTKTIAAMGVTDFLDLRGVDIDVGTSSWLPIKPYRFSSRGRVGTLSYRLRGTTLEVQPAELASTYPYRIHYVYLPADLVNAGDTTDLPLGGDTYIAHGVAAALRPSFEEDPSADLKMQELAEAQVRRFLVTHGQGPAEAVREADGYDDDWILNGGWD